MQVQNPVPSWLCAIGLFLAVFILHGSSAVTTENSDSRWSIFTAHSIIHEFNTDLKEFEGELARWEDYCIYRVGGVPYNLFPVIPSLVAVPFVYAYEKAPGIMSRILPGMKSARRAILETGKAPSPLRIRGALERAAASFVIAVTTVTIFAMSRTVLPLSASTLLALLFAFGTSAWSTASRSLWQHGPSMLFTSFVLLQSLRGARSRGGYAMLGMALALAYVTRPTNAPFVLAMLAYHFLRNRPVFALIMTPCAIVWGIFILWSYLTFGTLIPPYYLPTRLLGTSTFLEALLGNLVSPARGLFIFSPIFLLSLWGIILLFRYVADPLFEVLLLSATVAELIALSLFPHWWGGFSYGPRLTSDLIPIGMYYLIPVAHQLLQRIQRRDFVLPLIAIILSACSIVIHFRGANDREVLRWDRIPTSVDLDPSRVWDWSDPPFLR